MRDTTPSSLSVLVIDPFEPNFREHLGKLPWAQVQYRPALRPQEVWPALQLAEVLIMKSKVQLGPRDLVHATRLKLVIRAGAGLEHLDVAGLEAAGVAVKNTPGGNAEAVGDHTLAMLLSLLTHLPQADASLRAGEWRREPFRGSELSSQTVGLVGYGRTGQAVGRRLSGFGCKVLAYDKYRTAYSDAVAQEADLAKIQAEATVLSFHVPLTAETQSYYDAGFQGQMAHPHWLLNLSRGGVVSLPAVAAGLRNGAICGAGLDVFPQEPPSHLSGAEKTAFQAILKHPATRLSPHIGGWTHESAANINALVLDALQHYAQQTGRL